MSDEPGAGPRSRGLVLVVEDEAVIADAERRYLTPAGCRVEVVGTAADAWAQIRRQRPVAVVLDMGSVTPPGWSA